MRIKTLGLIALLSVAASAQSIPPQNAGDDAKREALIARSQKSGLLGKIDWQAQTVIVGAEFMAMDFNVKQAVAWVIVLTGMRKTNTPDFNLQLMDQKTGKRVGYYYPTAVGKLVMD